MHIILLYKSYLFLFFVTLFKNPNPSDISVVIIAPRIIKPYKYLYTLYSNWSTLLNLNIHSLSFSLALSAHNLNIPGKR